VRKKINKRLLVKIVGILFLIIFLFYFIFNSSNIIKKSTSTFMVENGSLSYEESVDGYIIRDETVLKGNNYSNGISQIVTDKARVSKGEAVFRYYSNNEEDINNQIAELDKQIDEALQNSQNTILPAVDINNLKNEIEKVLDEMYGESEIQAINEYKKKINSYVVKKAEIAGELSPAGSYIKNLIEQRTALSNQLTIDSETISAPKPGLISYRVDGLEEVLNYNDGNFDYINTELLDSFKLDAGMSISESQEAGKIVNNYECYIACPINTDNSEVAEVGDSVILKFSDSNEVSAKIIQINEEENSRVIIFKITENVENLLDYRKVSLEIVWWKYSGWKISNAALIEKDDLTYVKRTRAGIQEEILVKVLRQNETFSIVENYSEEELVQLGYTIEEIENMPKIKLYDEIMLKR